MNRITMRLRKRQPAAKHATPRAPNDSVSCERRLVREAGVEPTTFGSGGRRSIQLSYSRSLLRNLGQSYSRGNLFRPLACNAVESERYRAEVRRRWAYDLRR